MKTQKLNKRQACQAFYLSRFDFTLKYVLGTKIKKTDRLSRKLDWKIGVEKDNENQTLIKEQWTHSLVEVEIVEKIKKARSKNEKVVRIVEEIKKAGVKVL